MHPNNTGKIIFYFSKVNQIITGIHNLLSFSFLFSFPPPYYCSSVICYLLLFVVFVVVDPCLLCCDHRLLLFPLLRLCLQFNFTLLLL